MNRFWKASSWVTRLILLFPTLLFLTIGVRDLSNVSTVMGGRGMAFTSGNGITVARVGFGAFPLACGLFLLGCVFFKRYLRVALGFVATLDAVVLATRVVGMYADSSVRENLPLVRAELLLLFLTAIGMLIEFTKQRRVVSRELRSATVGR